ncbi:MAG TPA: XRE family transcriptional regulator [Chloroflexia bacterium]|jgi:Zn-dependent peptidase ImmA (M78 family)
MPGVSEHASINPDLLRWARETSGYSLEAAAKKIDIDPSLLLRAEQVTATLTVPQLRKAAVAYKRPADIFYLSEPPAPLPQPRDFRTVGNTNAQNPELTPDMRLEWRRALLKRATALELLAEQGESPPTISIKAKISEDPEGVAQRVTNWLDISAPKRPYNRAPRLMLNNWIRLIEAHGVLVFQTSGIEIEEARGLSYWAKELPFILLNGKDAYRPRLFTLLHELVHLLLRETGSACDPLRSGVNLSPIETFCNRVAAAILIPRENILEHPLVIRRTSVRQRWPDSVIQKLADKYGVSRQVLLIRLQHLGLTDSLFVQNRLEAFEEEYRRSELNKPKVVRTGGPLPSSIALRDNGRRFCRLVLTAVDANVISEIDAANYLGLKTKHFDTIRDAIERAG